LDEQKNTERAEKRAKLEEAMRLFDEQSCREFETIRPEAEKTAVPSVRLVKESSNTIQGISKFGGLPDVPKGFVWPRWQDKALSFLLQVQLSKIKKDILDKGCPSIGMLYFFYDCENQPWGMYPNEKGSWRVVYHPDETRLNASEKPLGLNEKHLFPEIGIRYEEKPSFPEDTPKNWSEFEIEGYYRFVRDQIGEPPIHQLGGFPQTLQGEMRLECQLVTNGLTLADYKTQRAVELAPGKVDWKLLLQLDTDIDYCKSFMWGDMGRLYFWYRPNDFRNNDFENIWLVLQCG